MVDVLLSSENIDILGGSTRIDTDVNIGSIGDRGSNIFVGTGDPNSGQTIIPESPKTYDMFINLDPNSLDFLFLYQYLNVSGEFSWVKLSRLIPQTFLENYVGDFVDGELKYIIPAEKVISFASTGIYTSDNFNIQHTVINDKPIASSVQLGTLEINEETGAYEIEVTVFAAEYDSEEDTWSNLDKEDVRVDFIVSVI
jgi:hypothetical protein